MTTGNAKKRRGLGRGLGALISAKPVPINPQAKSQGSQGGGAPVVAPAHGSNSRSSKPNSGLANGLTSSGSNGGVDTPHVPSGSTPSLTTLASQDTQQEMVTYLSLTALSPNPDQPRKLFRSEEITELADSIRTLGVLQPIVVRPLGDQFQIIAGERRWRAATEAKIEQVPVIIKDFNDMQALEVGLVENVQRSDLSSLEEARGYNELMKRFQLTQADVATKVGKNRTTVANALRLLKLPLEVQAFIESKALSVGHAKAILSVREPRLRIALAHKAVKERLSVRELERIVARKVSLKGGASPARGEQNKKSSKEREVHRNLVSELQKVLGTKVRIVESTKGRGKISIEYFSTEELERIYEMICFDED